MARLKSRKRKELIRKIHKTALAMTKTVVTHHVAYMMKTPDVKWFSLELKPPVIDLTQK